MAAEMKTSQEGSERAYAIMWYKPHLFQNGFPL